MAFFVDWSRLDTTASEAIRLLINAKLQEIFPGPSPAAASAEGEKNLPDSTSPPKKLSRWVRTLKRKLASLRVEYMEVGDIRWGNSPPLVELVSFEDALPMTPLSDSSTSSASTATAEPLRGESSAYFDSATGLHSYRHGEVSRSNLASSSDLLGISLPSPAAVVGISETASGRTCSARSGFPPSAVDLERLPRSGSRVNVGANSAPLTPLAARDVCEKMRAWGTVVPPAPPPMPVSQQTTAMGLAALHAPTQPTHLAAASPVLTRVVLASVDHPMPKLPVRPSDGDVPSLDAHSEVNLASVATASMVPSPQNQSSGGVVRSTRPSLHASSDFPQSHPSAEFGRAVDDDPVVAALRGAGQSHSVRKAVDARRCSCLHDISSTRCPDGVCSSTGSWKNAKYPRPHDSGANAGLNASFEEADTLATVFGPNGLFIRLHVTYGGTLEMSVNCVAWRALSLGGAKIKLRMPIEFQFDRVSIDCFININLHHNQFRIWLTPGGLFRSPITRLRARAIFGNNAREQYVKEEGRQQQQQGGAQQRRSRTADRPARAATESGARASASASPSLTRRAKQSEGERLEWEGEDPPGRRSWLPPRRLCAEEDADGTYVEERLISQLVLAELRSILNNKIVAPHFVAKPLYL